MRRYDPTKRDIDKEKDKDIQEIPSKAIIETFYQFYEETWPDYQKQNNNKRKNTLKSNLSSL